MPENLAIGLLAVAVGVAGWLLPYRWNPLRLRRGFARRFSAEANERVPKIVGTVLIAVGLFLVAGSLLRAPETGAPAADRAEARTRPAAEREAAASAEPEPVEEPVLTPPSPEADTRLLAASRAGDIAEVRAALADGADPDARGAAGWTALLTAIDFERPQVIEALLAGGADPDLPVTEGGGTPLIYAVLTGNLEIVRLLVDGGADLEKRGDVDELTPLLAALSVGNREVARFLVDRGADVETRDRHGLGADDYLDGSTLEEFLADD